MKIYKLSNVQPDSYGDFVSVLVAGTIRQRENGWLQLERTGPFVPKMIVSGISNLVLTNDTKEALERDFKDISFKRVIKKRIVYLDWSHWQRDSHEPPWYPESGDAIDYILQGEHSPHLSEEIGDMWELELPRIGRFSTDGCFIINGKTPDLWMAKNKGFILVTEKSKSWIEKKCAQWVTFEEVHTKRRLWERWWH